MGTNGAYSDKCFVIKSTGILEERSNNSLHATNNFFVKDGAGVLSWGQLMLDPIGDFTVFMRRELGLLGIYVTEFKEECFSVSFHRREAATLRVFGGVCTLKFNA